MRTHRSHFRGPAEVPPPRGPAPYPGALTHPARRLEFGARESLASWRRGVAIGSEDSSPPFYFPQPLREHPSRGICDWRVRARQRPRPPPPRPDLMRAPHVPSLPAHSASPALELPEHPSL